ELENKHLISIKDLSLQDIQSLFLLASEFKKNPNQPLLKNKIIANCFFEPSTRTRLSFEAAALKLGANVLGFSSDEATSTKKGESLQDTIRVMCAYADLIVVRHAKEGAARAAACVSSKPIINAGDGANQHPTQALVDLFTMQECQKDLQGLSLGLVGDLKYGRTIHSLAEACALFNIRLFLVSPSELSLPETIADKLKKQGVRYSLHQSLEDIIPKVDVLYMTRLQQERFSALESRINTEPYQLTLNMLSAAKPNLKILHPLPRLTEIDKAIDDTPYSYYFQQAENGVYIRQALLVKMLGVLHA
ncbi:MAG: aspartate carbamoyltransferase, partial [Gammaproteobacteria bacterium]